MPQPYGAVIVACSKSPGVRAQGGELVVDPAGQAGTDCLSLAAEPGTGSGLPSLCRCVG
jgi:hypothetical protein